MVRRGPGVSRQESRGHRVGHEAGCRLIKSDTRRFGNAGQSHDSNFFLLPFIIQEEKCLVLYDRPAERASKLVVVEWRLRFTRGIEEIARIQSVVAEILEGGAVNLVGSTSRYDVDDCAAIPAVLRFKIGEHAHVAHRVDGKDRRRRGEYAALINGWIVPVAVIHVRSVEQIVIRSAARAVHGKFTKGSRRIRDLIWRACYAGIQIDQLRVIASIDRQVLYRLLRERASKR